MMKVICRGKGLFFDVVDKKSPQSVLLFGGMYL